MGDTCVSLPHREGRQLRGDDFTFIWDEAALTWAEEFLNGRYEVKVRARMGPLAEVGSFLRGESEVQGVSVGGVGFTGGLKELDVARFQGGGK